MTVTMLEIISILAQDLTNNEWSVCNVAARLCVHVAAMALATNLLFAIFAHE